MKQILLFDLDGTLTDPGEGITKSVAYALEKMGHPPLDQKTLYDFIGPPLVDHFMEVCGFTKDEAMQAVGHFRAYFTPQGIFENRAYDGIGDLLRTLQEQGRKLIVTTSKPEPFAVKILKYFDLAQYFDAVVGSTFEETRTYKWEIIAHFLRLDPGVEPKQMVMIGDRKHDVEGAHRNKIPAIGVSYGYGGRKELEQAGADWVVDSVAELKELLLEGTI